MSPKIRRPDNADTLRGRQGSDYVVYNKDKEFTSDPTRARRGKSDKSLATLGDIKAGAWYGFDLSLSTDNGWTKVETAGGTATFTNNTVVFASGGVGNDEASIYNSTAFNLSFSGEWEIELTFSKLGEQSPRAYGVAAFLDAYTPIYVGCGFGWGNFENRGWDETYIYGGGYKNGMPSIYSKLCKWSEDTAYTLKMIGRGTSVEFYVNGVCYWTLPDVATNITSSTGTLDLIFIDYTSLDSGTYGDCILTGLNGKFNDKSTGVAALANEDIVGELASIILETTPTNGETEKTANSNWSFDHNANTDAHHNKGHTHASTAEGGTLTWDNALSVADAGDHDHSANTEGGSALAPLSITMAGGAGSYITLPALTLTQRDALTPAVGMIIRNTTWNTIDICWSTTPYWYSIPIADLAQIYNWWLDNAYNDGSNFRYKTDGTAASLAISVDGTMTLSNAISGLADGDITWVTLFSVDNVGNIVVPDLATVDGRDVSVDGTKLDGIEAGAKAYPTKLDGIPSGFLTYEDGMVCHNGELVTIS